MKKLFTVLMAVACFHVSAQNVGINTNTPATTLQVVGQPATATVADGITIPKLTGDQLKAKDAKYTSTENGTMVYITAAVGTASTKTTNVTAAGFYYFDGLLWQRVTSAATTDTTNDAWVNNGSGNPYVTTQNVGIGDNSPATKLSIISSTAGGGLKLVDGTQSSGKILTSDANGNAQWANVTSVNVTPTALGTLPASGITISNLGTRYYTNAYITLSPGKWIVSAGTTLTTNTGAVIGAADGQIWAHIYLSDVNVGAGANTADLMSGGALAGAGSLGRGMRFGMATGNFLINNTSGVSKTYYVWMDCDNNGATISERVKDVFSSSIYERWLFANPIN